MYNQDCIRWLALIEFRSPCVRARSADGPTSDRRPVRRIVGYQASPVAQRLTATVVVLFPRSHLQRHLANRRRNDFPSPGTRHAPQTPSRGTAFLFSLCWPRMQRRIVVRPRWMRVVSMSPRIIEDAPGVIDRSPVTDGRRQSAQLAVSVGFCARSHYTSRGARGLARV